MFKGELKSGYINENYIIKNRDGNLRNVESIFPHEKSVQIDTTSAEKIIGIRGVGYGSFGDDKSNFITIYIETNKKHNDKLMNKMSFRHNMLIDSIRKDCNTKKLKP